jgi:hypothetical protein
VSDGWYTDTFDAVEQSAGKIDVKISMGLEDEQPGVTSLFSPVLVKKDQWYNFSITVRPEKGECLIDPGSMRLKGIPRPITWEGVWTDIKKLLRKGTPTL